MGKMKIFNFEEKTGISQSALAAFVTATALGVVPFFGLDIPTNQAINLGLCSATAIAWALRQYHKSKSVSISESDLTFKEQISILEGKKNYAEIAADRLKEDKNADTK